MFFISKFIANTFGLDISKVQRWVIIAALVLIGIIVIATALWIRSCSSAHRAKVDAAQAEKLKQAIQTKNDDRIKEILAEADAKADNIDANIKQAEENTRQAKKSYDGMDHDALAAEAERRLQESQP